MTDDEVRALLITSLLGAVFVLIHAITRFNMPPSNRTSTTAARYWAATLAYCGLHLGLYAILVAAQYSMGSLVPELSGLAKNLPDPLFAALLLTILLPTVPLLKELDQWSRSWLQNIALIPHEARRISAEIRHARFLVAPALQSRVCQEFKRVGLHSSDAVFQETGDAERIWTKVTALILQIRDWETDRRFSGFVTDFGEEYSRIKSRYEHLALKTRTWFGKVRELITADDARTASLAHHYQDELVEQCSDLHQALCDFVCHGILKCELTFASVSARLRTLGFDHSVAPRRLTLNRVMMIFGVVSIVLVFGFVTLGKNKEGDSMNMVIAKTVMIAIIYSVGICCAIHPKEWWAQARRDKDGDRPVAVYFLSSTAAAGACLLISHVFWWLMTFELGQSWEAWRSAAWGKWAMRYPWALLTFITTFTIAWLADNMPPTEPRRSRQRVHEGLALASIAVLSSIMVLMWLEDFAPKDPLTWARVLTLNSIIGFVIGFLVPTWYREAPREQAPYVDLEIPLPQAENEGRP